jgi:hypothetical protein
MGLRLDATRKHITPLEVDSTMITKDTDFLVDTILVETTFWSYYMI